MWVFSGVCREAGQVPDPQHEHGPGRDPAHRRARAQPQGQQVLMIDALVFLVSGYFVYPEDFFIKLLVFLLHLLKMLT